MTRLIARRGITRRGLIAAGSATAASLVTGCEPISDSPSFRWLLDFGQFMSLHAQRLLLSSQPLVREYNEADISLDFPPNGTERPVGVAYFQMMLSNFAQWRLTVDGMVRNQLSLSLDEIKALPSRTQITMHNCDEGWSAIGQWTGVPLAHLLQTAELLPEARYIVFHCLDEMLRTPDHSGFYYESLDLFDAMHPQTILAYGMNGKALPVEHGAPLRLRVERQIGYKHAKYVTRIEAVDRLNAFGKGKGGFWEDRGYQWYAGQ
jgi:DMSO/TMAO reductase YedYZ molybdopterin-dependent catalytic subunit